LLPLGVFLLFGGSQTALQNSQKCLPEGCSVKIQISGLPVEIMPVITTQHHKSAPGRF
jgi:hypothetical protein